MFSVCMYYDTYSLCVYHHRYIHIYGPWRAVLCAILRGLKACIHVPCWATRPTQIQLAVVYGVLRTRYVCILYQVCFGHHHHLSPADVGAHSRLLEPACGAWLINHHHHAASSQLLLLLYYYCCLRITLMWGWPSKGYYTPTNVCQRHPSPFFTIIRSIPASYILVYSLKYVPGTFISILSTWIIMRCPATAHLTYSTAAPTSQQASGL